MGLIQLIKGLSNADKGRLLGKETTRIIRYSFVNSDHEALPTDILDTAVALHAGIDLVNKSKNREMLIETLSESKLRALGFDGSSMSIYDKAIKTYSKDLERFIADFDSWESLAQYQQHPDHKKLGARLVENAVGGLDGILVFDLPTT